MAAKVRIIDTAEYKEALARALLTHKLLQRAKKFAILSRIEREIMRRHAVTQRAYWAGRRHFFE